MFLFHLMCTVVVSCLHFGIEVVVEYEVEQASRHFKCFLAIAEVVLDGDHPFDGALSECIQGTALEVLVVRGICWEDHLDRCIRESLLILLQVLNGVLTVAAVIVMAAQWISVGDVWKVANSPW